MRLYSTKAWYIFGTSKPTHFVRRESHYKCVLTNIVLIGGDSKTTDTTDIIGQYFANLYSDAPMTSVQACANEMEIAGYANIRQFQGRATTAWQCLNPCLTIVTNSQ